MKKRIVSLMLGACMLTNAVVLPASAAVIPAEPSDSVLREEIACDAPLPFTAYYTSTDGATLAELTAFDADVNKALASYNGGITTESTTGIPCQIFEVDTSGVTSDAVVLTLAASTVENERLALKAYNVKNASWDTLDTAITEGRLGAKIAIADYADENGIIKAMATPDYVANGSNRLIWSTDQQHYTKHEDLYYFYYGIHEYMAEEYKNNNIGYVINTGDIVDNSPYTQGCAEQWEVASDAFSILDEAGVPYGIETGNHDVGDYPATNYDFYLQHFAAERYLDKPWFGGTEDDNVCHYDLVTVGNIDLLVMYIGYGVEGNKTVVEWANEVLAMYPHRSAIICTHEYIAPTSLQYDGRGEQMYKDMVEPHDNVVMVLCGHNEGACYITRDEDGRLIQEVCADYQFVQVEDEEYYADHEDPLHYIGNTPGCNGEGYIREVIFNGDTVSMYAFSPVTGGETPFGLRDDITLELTLPETKRFITSYQFAAVVPNPNKGEDFLEKFTLSEGGKAFAYTNGGESDVTKTVTSEKGGLEALIADAEAIDMTVFTKASGKALQTAIDNAKTALSGTDSDITTAFTALQDAMGAMEEQKEIIIPDYLTTVHELDLNDYAWKNGSGIEKVTSPYSEITFTKNENGGFTAMAASGSGWPQIQYIAPVTFTPEDGRVYLYLDIEAGSTWSFYPRIMQDNNQFTGRLNYVIEGSYNNLYDAGSGTYKGVFEITDGLKELTAPDGKTHLDLTKEMTMMLDINVVPGPLTVNAMSVLTGTPKTMDTLLSNVQKIDQSQYTPGSYQALVNAINAAKAALESNDQEALQVAYRDLNAAKNGLTVKETPDILMIVLIVVAAIVVVGLIVFAILYKPKKKESAANEKPPVEAETPASEDTEKDNNA